MTDAMQRYLIASLLFFSASSQVDAQALPQVATPRIFIGAGAALGTDDSDHRMRLSKDELSNLWLVEGGIRLSSRIGLGAEFALTSDVIGMTAGSSFNQSAKQSERTIVSVIRVHTVATEVVALDVVAGGGVLLQHHELRYAPCYIGCADIIRDSRDIKAPAFVVGADVPFRVGEHISLGGFIRYYALRRANRAGERNVQWPYETKPSARTSVGVSARATW